MTILFLESTLNMSHSIRISTNLRISHSTPSSSRESPKLLFSRLSHVSGFKSPSLVAANLVCLSRFRAFGTQIISPTACSEGVNFGDLDDSLALVEVGSICSETQFDTILSEAQRLQEPVIIIWMASWCRKCIYLKPKLEKLAAEYYPRIQFYCVDVNAVPHKLVVRAAVTKMPTIQIWKDGEKQSEVIGGHKAHLVVSEVRAMIEN